MITRPSTSQLLRTVSHDLLAVVAPAIDDQAVVVTVQMMAAVLDAAAVRCENEANWMRAESAAILEVAARVAAAIPDTAELDAALAASAVGDSDAVEAYERASEALSCAAEVVLGADLPDLRGEVEQLLAARLANELTVIGANFEVIGRG